MGKLERISAFMDGELEESGHEQVIAGLASDRDACGAWERFHVIGDVLREGSAPKTTLGLAERVRARVELEPAVLAPRKLPRAVSRPALGLAIAASVATIAVLGTRHYAPERTPGIPLAHESRLVESTAVLADADGPEVVAPAIPIHEHNAEQESYLRDPRLNSYLVNFNEQRSSLGVPGVHPYVRIVGFEAE